MEYFQLADEPAQVKKLLLDFTGIKHLVFFEEAMQQGHPALGGKPCELLIASALPLATQPCSVLSFPRQFLSAFVSNII